MVTSPSGFLQDIITKQTRNRPLFQPTTNVLSGQTSTAFPAAPQPATVSPPPRPQTIGGMLSSPEFISTLSSLGTAISPQGSPGARVGQAVTQRMQSQRFNDALGGGPVSPILSPEQQALVLQQRNQTEQQRFANELALQELGLTTRQMQNQERARAQNRADQFLRDIDERQFAIENREDQQAFQQSLAEMQQEAINTRARLAREADTQRTTLKPGQQLDFMFGINPLTQMPELRVPAPVAAQTLVDAIPGMTLEAAMQTALQYEQQGQAAMRELDGETEERPEAETTAAPTTATTEEPSFVNQLLNTGQQAAQTILGQEINPTLGLDPPNFRDFIPENEPLTPETARQASDQFLQALRTQTEQDFVNIENALKATTDRIINPVLGPAQSQLTTEETPRTEEPPKTEIPAYGSIDAINADIAANRFKAGDRLLFNDQLFEVAEDGSFTPVEEEEQENG